RRQQDSSETHADRGNSDVSEASVADTLRTLLDEKPPARRRIHRYHQRSGETCERHQRLPLSQSRHAIPQACVDRAYGSLQAADNGAVSDLVDDEVVQQSEHLIRKVLRQLRYEDKAEPALPATLRNARNLLEQHGHLSDAVCRQEFVRLLNDD